VKYNPRRVSNASCVMSLDVMLEYVRRNHIEHKLKLMVVGVVGVVGMTRGVP
jgi:hypothetical protein